MTGDAQRRGVGELHLGRLGEDSFERLGDHQALLFDGTWHRSGELFDRSCRIAAGLISLGVQPGDRVIVTMGNCPEVGVVYQAIWRAGAVVTPAVFLLPPDDLRHVIADAEARVVVTTAEFVPKVMQAVDGLENLGHMVCIGEAGSATTSLAELEAAEPGPVVSRADDDLAALLYTGGTTGRAKGVMLTHANLHFASRASHDFAPLLGLNRELITLPLSHSFGLIVTLTAMHSPERRITVLTRRFEPSQFLMLVAEQHIQHTSVVPSMLQFLLSQPLEEYDLNSLRYLFSGGAPLAPEVVEEFARRVPSAAIVEGYGLTETSTLLSSNPLQGGKPGSVGTPLPGVEACIVDNDGRSLPTGQTGEICCRSRANMRGYWNSPEPTAEVLRDGWLHTGDIGYFDEDGYLFIVDRMKDLIIRGGFNVYPRDVEEALLKHPGVQMAGVIGKPDRLHGEEVVAFVSTRPDAELSADELITWAREHIGGYRYPREVQILESLPLTAVGKVDRKALRATLP